MDHHKGLFLSYISLFLLLSSAALKPALADIPGISGGGNIGLYQSITNQTNMIAALQAGGTPWTRLNIYPNDYYNRSADGGQPAKVDTLMGRLAQSGITPTLLFEYYGTYTNYNILSYTSWYNIGRDYATRWQPNSPYLLSQGISNWGVTVYSALNEPDGTISLRVATNDYYNMLSGLADGVHSVNSSLKVVPGGFCSENAHSDHTLMGYGTTIAPLLNSGKLDGIDLHTYNDIYYAPIVWSNGTSTFNFSPQSDFDSIKTACGITNDINFYATEYNFKTDANQGINNELAAKRLLTDIWANVGVVKSNGTSATQLAMVWNLTTTNGIYQMATDSDPWTPNEKGKTFEMVMRLSDGLEYQKLDPKGRGEFILTNAYKKMWVWQNYTNWSNIKGTNYMVTGIPEGYTTLEVYDWNSWDAPERSYTLTGETSYLVANLNQQETYMFVATIPEPSSVLFGLLAGATVVVVKRFRRWTSQKAIDPTSRL